jgi:hypothetical protein
MKDSLDALRAATLQRAMGAGGRLPTTALNATAPATFSIGKKKNKPLAPAFDAQDGGAAAMKRAIINRVLQGNGNTGVGQR